MRHRSGVFTLGLLLLALSNTAVAHPGHDAAGWLSGLSHPLTGIDHLLAMLAVGLWAGTAATASAGRFRSILRLPAIFLAACGVGTVMGFGGLFGPWLEGAVAISLLPLGLALMFRMADHRAAAAALTLICGVLHGAAHGTEFAALGSASQVAGFLLGTALLHAVGLLIGFALPRVSHAGCLRGVGLGLATAAVVLVT